jgi:hypothetical protein
MPVVREYTTARPVTAQVEKASPTQPNGCDNFMPEASRA